MICILRSILSLICFVVFTAVMATTGIVLNVIFNKRSFDDSVLQVWASGACWLFNVKVHVVDIRKFNSSKGAIVLFNHSSFMDVLAIASVLRGIRFGAKIELFKIPIFGYCMRRLGMLPIARNKREEVFKVYQEAQSRFEKGDKIALSPEGGRFHGSSLSSFKSGPFVFALNAGVPLLPVVVKGAYDVWPKGSILANPDKWMRQVSVHVLDPISTQGYTLDERTKLQNESYEVMNDVYRN